MALAARFSELLERLTCATARTAGADWDQFSSDILREFRDMDSRLSFIEESVRSRNTLSLPKGKRG